MLIPNVEELAEGETRIVGVSGVDMLAIRFENVVYAVSATCPHRGGPLATGLIASGVIVCPWHGSEFRIADGALVAGPSKCALKTWPLTLDGVVAYVSLG
ncbi:Rieske (2Fe-2S) protein [Roseomonas sp. CECT 9278]|uniref:Rieske (2Fe-2S) protein n=1 Tax=Roseomonas sp. CECT 9278 TaxID=2845823 RepID=UPI0035AC1827